MEGEEKKEEEQSLKDGNENTCQLAFLISNHSSVWSGAMSSNFLSTFFSRLSRSFPNTHSTAGG